jgi:hypothetical protein
MDEGNEIGDTQMIEMNPYYARESEVGPVFDVATFSRGKALGMGITGLVFGVVVAAAVVYAWNPTRIMPRPPRQLADLNRETARLWRDHPQAMPYGLSTAGLVAAFFLVASGAYLYQSLTGDMYLRVGEGGLSLRVPNGFHPLELDLPWNEIDQLTVTQRRQVGALSRNAGNLGGDLTLRTRSHGQVFVGLDDFREPAHLIYNRIQEARQTRPAELVASI